MVVRPLVPIGDCYACTSGNDHICYNLNFLGLDCDGAFQEKWNVPASTLHKIPSDLKLEYAALIEPLAVACHDVNRSRLVHGEDVLVIGGGPIGLLIAMVAKHKGANVIISEVNETRLSLAREIGFKVINPVNEDIEKAINNCTDNKGVSVLFEVSGSSAGVAAMTKCAAVRARIVMVAIHGKPQSVDLFQFFWRELELIGARVYTSDDYEDAINLITSNAIDCEKLITNISSIDDIQHSFEMLDSSDGAMKSLICCNN